jgi:hypothetical protein
MGKRQEQELDAIRLYADGTEIPAIAVDLQVSENSLRQWKKRAGTEWDDARRAARKGQLASMEDVGSRIRRSREITTQLTGNAKNQGELGLLLNQSLQTMVFDMLGQISTTGIVDMETMAATTDQLKGLSLTLARLEKSASDNLKRDAEIRNQAHENALKLAAATAVKTVKTIKGATDEQIEQIRADILGVEIQK